MEISSMCHVICGTINSGESLALAQWQVITRTNVVFLSDLYEQTSVGYEYR